MLNYCFFLYFKPEHLYFGDADSSQNYKGNEKIRGLKIWKSRNKIKHKIISGRAI